MTPTPPPVSTPPPSPAASAPGRSASTGTPAQAAGKNAPKKSRKGGGCLRRILLILVALAVAAGVLYWQLPSSRPVFHAAVTGIADSVSQPPSVPDSTSIPESSPTPVPSGTDSVPRFNPAPLQKRIAALEKTARELQASGTDSAASDSLRREVAALRRELSEMQSRLNQIQTHPTTSPGIDNPSRLTFIAAMLQSSGDTQAAADALRRVADAPELSPDFAERVRAESRRLEQTPARPRVLGEIADLRRLLQKPFPPAPAASDDNNATDDSLSAKLAAVVRGAFNISRRHSAASESARADILAALARMEFYLVARNRDEYMRALQSVAELWNQSAPPGADANIALKIKLLREYGAPDYRLNLPPDKLL